MGPSSPRPVRPTRQRVLMLLSQPRCAREIRERMPGSRRKQIETALHRLAQDRLVECATPGVRQSRLYRRSYLGDMLVFELTGERPAPRADADPSELDLQAFVQAGRYRRLVLRAMSGEQRPKEIRKAVLAMYKRIGAGHVHGVLREFRTRGIAARDDSGRWSLTQLGEGLRAAELDGLPERPAIVRPLWEKIQSAEQAPGGEDAEREQQAAEH